MGTSTNQHSPITPNWNRVTACYKDAEIPELNVINQIWRAAEAQEKPISDFIKSEAIFKCYETVSEISHHYEANNIFQNYILENSNNSIVVEFAKRAIIPAYGGTSPSLEWSGHFFTELTSYFISRDAPGFVNKNYKNKTVKDLIKYKERIKTHIRHLIMSDERDINSLTDWKQFVDSSINKLKGYNEQF